MKKGILLIKVGLGIVGLLFIYHLLTNSDRLYGKIESIQFLTLMGLLYSSIIGLVFSSIIKNKIETLSKEKEVKIYCSSAIQILIAYIGVIAIILSVLFGANMTSSTSVEERIKLSDQNLIWFGFSVYSIFVMIVLFIHPLIKRLGSFE